MPEDVISSFGNEQAFSAELLRADVGIKVLTVKKQDKDNPYNPVLEALRGLCWSATSLVGVKGWEGVGVYSALGKHGSRLSCLFHHLRTYSAFDRIKPDT